MATETTENLTNNEPSGQIGPQVVGGDDDLGIKHNSGKDRLVVVRVKPGAVVIEGARRKGGDEFVTTVQRAAALGSSIDIMDRQAPAGIGINGIVPKIQRATPRTFRRF